MFPDEPVQHRAVAPRFIFTEAPDADRRPPCDGCEQFNRLPRFGVTDDFSFVRSGKLLENLLLLETAAAEPVEQLPARCYHRQPDIEVSLLRPLLLPYAARRM